MINEKLIVITSRKIIKQSLESFVKEILESGCKAVLLREKDLIEKEYEELLKKILPIFKDYNAYLIVHKFINIAAKYYLPLHLTGDQSISNAREILGKEAIIGKSCHSFEEALNAEKQGASYVFLGPVFDSISKEGYKSRISLDYLEKACKNLNIPVYAIGGIEPSNVKLCLNAGCHGVAVLGYVSLSEKPGERVKEIIKAFQ